MLITRIAAIAFTAVSLVAQKPAEIQGIAPRATPADYQAQTTVGAYTLAAEFTGHSISTAEGVLTTDQYVVVEAALFGSPDAKLQLSLNDFGLRINGKKQPAPSASFMSVVESVQDPEWAPPAAPKESKTSFGSKGSRSADNGPPAPVKVPIEVQRSIAQRVKKLSMPEGERTLPRAGLLYFQFSGKAKNIHSVELVYSGPAGNATLELRP